MATGNDDYERLLAEVDQALGGKKPAPASTPARRAESKPARREQRDAQAERGGRVARATGRATQAAVVAGVVFALLGFFLPVLTTLGSGAAAFVTAWVAVFAEELRRR